MADLVEANNWDIGIYQLETVDPVEGGPGGIDNRQAQALANRTKYLKAQQEAHAAAADPHPQYMTTAESDAAIAAAVAALVASSPAALDTLAEFATALGNDPNFATTITNLLALKAPLNSPALTGAPSAPKPAKLDNSTKIATTSFVKESGITLSSFNQYNASSVLGESVVGSLVEFYGATAGQTLTLPISGNVRSADSIAFINMGSVAFTLARQGTDVINGGGTTLVLQPGDTLQLTAGVGSWFVTGGTGGNQLSAGFSVSKSTTGYQKLPSGLIIQWGVFTFTVGVTAVIPLPIAFPTACVTAGGLPSANNGSDFTVRSASMVGLGTGNISLNVTGGSSTSPAVAWFAIGY